MRKIIFALIMTSVALNAYAFNQNCAMDYIPNPRLISPASDEVVLTGKSALEFRWSTHEGLQASRRYYEFRLYDGGTFNESALILKKDLSGKDRDLEVDTKLFKDGHLYTWSLRLAYKGVGRSSRSTLSFKVTK